LLLEFSTVDKLTKEHLTRKALTESNPHLTSQKNEFSKKRWIQLEHITFILRHQHDTLRLHMKTKTQSRSIYQ